MSILLDALKKSEEQRQLGKTPEIHDRDDYEPGASRGGQRGWIPLALVAVAAVLIAAIVWQQFEEPEVEAIAGDPGASQRRVPGISAGAARQQSGPEAESSTARTPVESFQQAEEPAGTDTDGTADDALEQKRQDLARSFNEYQEADPEPEQAEVAEAEPVKAVPQPPARTPRQAPAAEAQSPHESEPVSYWELPQNVRTGMPQLRVSVIVYAENPEDRFLLMNGRRVVEKQAVEGLVLEEIRRDGAVFSYRNYRFLLKR